MKRQTFRAVVTTAGGETIIGERDTYAWNSAIRATEAILREYARDHIFTCSGAAPVVMDQGTPERIYRRVWFDSSGREYHAMVWQPA